jgi:hypothetical protein
MYTNNRSLGEKFAQSGHPEAKQKDLVFFACNIKDWHNKT